MKITEDYNRTAQHDFEQEIYKQCDEEDRIKVMEIHQIIKQFIENDWENFVDYCIESEIKEDDISTLYNKFFNILKKES